MTRKIAFRLARFLIYVFAVIVSPIFSLGLRALGYKNLTAILLGLSPNPHNRLQERGASLHRSSQVGKIVNRASAFGWFKASCLERSLLLWWILRWFRIPTSVRVGIQRGDTQFIGHAWVEYDGIVVNDRRDVSQRYVVFPDKLSPDKITKFV